MKRFLSALCVAVMVMCSAIMFVGCGDDDIGYGVIAYIEESYIGKTYNDAGYPEGKIYNDADFPELKKYLQSPFFLRFDVPTSVIEFNLKNHKDIKTAEAVQKLLLKRSDIANAHVIAWSITNYGNPMFS